MTPAPPLAPARIMTVWAWRYPWYRAYVPDDATWDAAKWYDLGRLQADLTQERPYPKFGAWVARRSSADDAWDVTRSNRTPHMVAQPDAVMDAALALMAGMDDAHTSASPVAVERNRIARRVKHLRGAAQVGVLITKLGENHLARFFRVMRQSEGNTAGVIAEHVLPHVEHQARRILLSFQRRDTLFQALKCNIVLPGNLNLPH